MAALCTSQRQTIKKKFPSLFLKRKACNEQQQPPRTGPERNIDSWETVRIKRLKESSAVEHLNDPVPATTGHASIRPLVFEVLRRVVTRLYNSPPTLISILRGFMDRTPIPPPTAKPEFVCSWLDTFLLSFCAPPVFHLSLYGITVCPRTDDASIDLKLLTTQEQATVLEIVNQGLLPMRVLSYQKHQTYAIELTEPETRMLQNCINLTAVAIYTLRIMLNTASYVGTRNRLLQLLTHQWPRLQFCQRCPDTCRVVVSHLRAIKDAVALLSCQDQQPSVEQWNTFRMAQAFIGPLQLDTIQRVMTDRRHLILLPQHVAFYASLQNVLASMAVVGSSDPMSAFAMNDDGADTLLCHVPPAWRRMACIELITATAATATTSDTLFYPPLQLLRAMLAVIWSQWSRETRSWTEIPACVQTIAAIIPGAMQGVFGQHKHLPIYTVQQSNWNICRRVLAGHASPPFPQLLASTSRPYDQAGARLLMFAAVQLCIGWHPELGDVPLSRWLSATSTLAPRDFSMLMAQAMAEHPTDITIQHLKAGISTIAVADSIAQYDYAGEDCSCSGSGSENDDDDDRHVDLIIHCGVQWQLGSVARIRQWLLLQRGIELDKWWPAGTDTKLYSSVWIPSEVDDLMSEYALADQLRAMCADCHCRADDDRSAATTIGVWRLDGGLAAVVPTVQFVHSQRAYATLKACYYPQEALQRHAWLALNGRLTQNFFSDCPFVMWTSIVAWLSFLRGGVLSPGSRRAGVLSPADPRFMTHYSLLPQLLEVLALSSRDETDNAKWDILEAFLCVDAEPKRQELFGTVLNSEVADSVKLERIIAAIRLESTASPSMVPAAAVTGSHMEHMSLASRAPTRCVFRPMKNQQLGRPLGAVYSGLVCSSLSESSIDVGTIAMFSHLLESTIYEGVADQQSAMCDLPLLLCERQLSRICYDDNCLVLLHGSTTPRFMELTQSDNGGSYTPLSRTACEFILGPPPPIHQTRKERIRALRAPAVFAPTVSSALSYSLPRTSLPVLFARAPTRACCPLTVESPPVDSKPAAATAPVTVLHQLPHDFNVGLNVTMIGGTTPRIVLTHMGGDRVYAIPMRPTKYQRLERPSMSI